MVSLKKGSVISAAMLFGLPLAMSANAAIPVDLAHQPATFMQTFLTQSAATNASQIKEISRAEDMRHKLHVRIQQMYSGHRVWGADAVMHIPNHRGMAKGAMNAMVLADVNTTMNGTFYQDLSADLANVPASLLTDAQAHLALQHAIELYQAKAGIKSDVKTPTTELIVYVDDNNKAHWAYKADFLVSAANESALPAKPVYILDAINFQVYSQWDDIKTIEDLNVPADNRENVLGGGYGGNKKMGEVVYDGKEGDLADFTVLRDPVMRLCYLQNKDVTVRHYSSNDVVTYHCNKAVSKHNDVFWDGEIHMVNGGYSPDNDAYFGGMVIKNMYQDWYKIPVLTTKDGQPMMLTMVVHAKMDNAYWDGKKMTFGDGVSMFYPLTSLGVAAHEISHGFTEQHSSLIYSGQSGGMNEAFSDMAAQAAELYAYGKNSWQIGPEIFKAKDEALRYMDQPSKDCRGKKPGNWCSIDDASQYTKGLDVHHSSGVYNHFFYLLGTSEGWNARKAFDVMVQANSHYWTASTDFQKGACGTISAAKDLGYDVESVKQAFNAVKIDTKKC